MHVTLSYRFWIATKFGRLTRHKNSGPGQKTEQFCRADATNYGCVCFPVRENNHTVLPSFLPANSSITGRIKVPSERLDQSRETTPACSTTDAKTEKITGHWLAHKWGRRVHYHICHSSTPTGKPKPKVFQHGLILLLYLPVPLCGCGCINLKSLVFPQGWWWWWCGC